MEKSILTQKYKQNIRQNYFNSSTIIIKIILLLFSINIPEVQAGPSGMNLPLADTYYFGSHYFKFQSTTHNSGLAFLYNSQPVYTFSQTFGGKVYQQVTSLIPIISSYQSTATDYFGFQVSANYSNDPTTNFNIEFKVQMNSSFIYLGFSIIVVTKPFDKIFIPHIFELNNHEVYVKKSYNIPSQYDNYVFFISFTGISDLGLACMNISTARNINSTSNQIQIKPTFQPNTSVSKVKILWIFFDKYTQKNTQQFNFLIHQSTFLSDIFGYANFQVNSNIYGHDIRKKCIIGIPQVLSLKRYQPKLIFNLSQTGVLGQQNSIATNGYIRTLCFKDYQCQNVYRYKVKRVIIMSQCFDCTDGITIPGGTVINYTILKNTYHCQIYNDTLTRYQFHYYHYQIINTCIVCSQCQYGYYLNIGQCILCSFTFQYCLSCTSSSCSSCEPLISLLNTTTQRCQSCNLYLSNCLECTNTTSCIKCQNKYALSTLDNMCKFVGCILYQPIATNSCIICDLGKKYVKKDDYCVCKEGYEINWINQQCEQICGDGYTYEFQCDDGNQNDLDGCKQCKIMPGFNCIVNFTSVQCKYQINLILKIQKIIKIQNGQAIIYITALNDIFPFPFSLQNFPSSSGNNPIQTKVKKPLFHSSSSYQHQYQYESLQSTIIQASGRSLKILIQYQFNIQDLFSQIYLKTQQTKYICANNQTKLNFKMSGLNQPLQIIEYVDLFKNLEIQTLVNSIISYLILLLGLFSRKYIGLECILTFQLIHYSKLLICPIEKYPAGFESLSYLKYSNGFNQIIQISDYTPVTEIQRKFYYFQTKKLIIQNYNISFIILFMFFLIFMVFLIIKYYRNKKEEIQAMKQHEFKVSAISHQKQSLISKISLYLYNSISQISKWSILQIIHCFAARIIISNQNIKYFTQINKQTTIFYLISSENFFIFIAFFIIISIGLNNFCNIYLNDLTFGVIKKRSKQLLYKKITFIYLFIIGTVIFFFNSQIIFNVIPMSLFVIIIHLIYLWLINLVVKPYKNSLQIHQSILFLNHVVFLIFLVQINVINFTTQINELVLITFGFLINLLCIIINLFTIIRLYYEYRYGQALQIQMKKKKIIQMKQKKIKQQQIINKKIDLLQNKHKIIKSKKDQIQQNLLLNEKTNQITKQNKFCLNMQKEQQQKQDLMTWLQKRNHLTRLQKQEYYFEKYQQKPLKWLQKNDKKKYQKALEQKSKIKDQIDQKLKKKYKKKNQSKMLNQQNQKNNNKTQKDGYQEVTKINNNKQLEKLKIKMIKQFERKKKSTNKRNEQQKN